VSHGHLGCEPMRVVWWRVPELTEICSSPLTATVLSTLEESLGVFGAAKRLGDAAAGALEATAA